MRLGSILHRAKLEPKLFKELLLIEPEEFPDYPPNKDGTFTVNKRRKDHRTELESFHAKNEGKMILSPKEFDLIMGQLSSLAYNPTCQAIFGGSGEAELSKVWDYQGFKCKGKADWVCNFNGLRTVVDLKKTQDASREAVERTIVHRLYDLQAAWYSRGFEAEQFIWVFVEEKPFAPGRHAIGVYRATGSHMDSGDALTDKLLSKLRVCEETNNWHSYTDGVQDAHLSDWRMKQIADGNI